MWRFLVSGRFPAGGEICQTLQSMGVPAALFADDGDLPALAAATGGGDSAACVLDVNYHEPLRLIAEELNIPYVSWSFDSGTARNLIPGGLRDTDLFFLHSKEDFHACAGKGIKAFFLPFSAGGEFVRPPVNDGFDFDVLLVMNSYWDSAQLCENGYRANLAAAASAAEQSFIELLKQLMELVVEAHRGVIDRDMMVELLDGYVAECGFDPFAEGGEARKRVFCAQYGQVLSHLQRVDLAEALVKAGFKVDIFGDDFWRARFDAFPNCAFRGKAEYRRLPEFYNRAKVNVNLTQIQNLESIPQRVFHVLAAGGMLLSNHSPVMEEFFHPGIHLDTFPDIPRLLDKVDYYLSRPDRRFEVATGGHGEFRRSHAMAGRLEYIISKLRAVAGNDGKPQSPAPPPGVAP